MPEPASSFTFSTIAMRGANDITPQAINDRGEVAGIYYDSSGDNGSNLADEHFSGNFRQRDTHLCIGLGIVGQRSLQCLTLRFRGPVSIRTASAAPLQKCPPVNWLTESIANLRVARCRVDQKQAPRNTRLSSCISWRSPALRA
jgi:hypothetical protein